MGQYFTNDDSLKSELRTIKYVYDEYSLLFMSDLGVFSKDKIDFGSRLLLENYLKYNNSQKKILDVGCGYGFLGVTISKITKSFVDMVDINKRAIHLTKMNIDNNKVNANAFISNCYEEINKRYDVIITNPPIRAGKVIYMNIINNAVNHLDKNGELWFVMHKDHGVKTTIKNISSIYDVNIIDKNKGFYVILCKKR